MHSLQNLDVDLPLRRLCVVTGVSGCGKSSLAIDTIAAEGQRRYLDALLIGRRPLQHGPPRPLVTAIENLPPTVMVGAAAVHPGSRSTVATVTELWPLLQALYVRLGTLYCPECQQPVVRQHRRDIVDYVRTLPERTRLLLLAPLVGSADERESSTPESLLAAVAREGFVRVRVNGRLAELSELSPERLTGDDRLEAVVDRLVVKDELPARLQESLETALTLGHGVCLTSAEVDGSWQDRRWATVLECSGCRTFFPPLEPASFHWNSPAGACAACQGTGWSPTAAASRYVREPCAECRGSRLNRWSQAVRIAGVSLADWTGTTLQSALEIARDWNADVAEASNRVFTTAAERTIAQRLLTEFERRLDCLHANGLGYLPLQRPAETLSRGEWQRARLATALGTRSQGLLYVFDEPTSGLHPIDMQRLLSQFRALCEEGNSVLVVEHQPDFIAACDWVIDLGPGAGPRGGQLVAAGTVEDVSQHQTSLTAAVLRDRCNGTAPLPWNSKRHSDTAASATLRLQSARLHHLQIDELALPIGQLTGVVGLSGSGKSTLVFDCLLPLVRARLDRQHPPVPAERGTLIDAGDIAAVTAIRGRLPGRSASATPATLSGIWDEVRRLYARTRTARQLGYPAARFSYRHPDSRCPRCLGSGRLRETDSLGSEWWATCPECRGRRYQRGLSAVRYRDLSVADLLELSIDAAAERFTALPQIARGLEILQSLGLGYLPLGQSGTTLSGGELQRLSLARALRKGGQVPTLYLFDEPTTGLHATEIAWLVKVLRQLTAHGHTVIVIEHSLDFLQQVDWLVELGPGSGPDGGRLVYQGPTSGIQDCKPSATATAWQSRSRKSPRS